MKIPFLTESDLMLVKSNVRENLDNYASDNNSWIKNTFEKNIFSYSRLGDIPEIILDQSSEINKSFETDANNSIKIYTALKFLSNVQAKDERLWAGLCLGPFWNYVQYRWNIKNDLRVDNILSHFFFKFYNRRSLTRNAISRLWWIARLTYDEQADDPFELTRYVCQNQRSIVDILERNFSNSLHILRPFIKAKQIADKENYKLTSNDLRSLVKYLDELGGIYVLDSLPEDEITDKLLYMTVKLSKEQTTC